MNLTCRDHEPLIFAIAKSHRRNIVIMRHFVQDSEVLEKRVLIVNVILWTAITKDIKKTHRDRDIEDCDNKDKILHAPEVESQQLHFK